MDFVKMHGAGNDFAIIDARRLNKSWPELAKRMCDRHFGVGADGIILVQPSRRANLRMRIFNPDGSEAEMCGNGIRCFTKYALERGIGVAEKKAKGLRVETAAGVHTCAATWRGGKVTQVKVSMGEPRLKPSEIPFDLAKGSAPAPGRLPARVLDWPLAVDGVDLKVTGVSMGNPHAVAFIDTPVDRFPLERIGPKVEHHPMFPRRVNFEIVNIVGRGRAKVRVWERGAGPTLACGSGATAVMVAAHLHGLAGDTLEVELPGGTLRLDWDGEREVWLTGPVEQVFTGTWPE